jgi:hypothetical protein
MQAFDVFGSRRAAAAVQALQPAAQDMECMSWAAAHRGQSLSALDHVNAEISVARCGALLDVLWEAFDLILRNSEVCSHAVVAHERGRVAAHAIVQEQLGPILQACAIAEVDIGIQQLRAFGRGPREAAAQQER